MLEQVAVVLVQGTEELLIQLPEQQGQPSASDELGHEHKAAVHAEQTANVRGHTASVHRCFSNKRDSHSMRQHTGLDCHDFLYTRLYNVAPHHLRRDQQHNTVPGGELWHRTISHTQPRVVPSCVAQATARAGC